MVCLIVFCVLVQFHVWVLLMSSSPPHLDASNTSTQQAHIIQFHASSNGQQEFKRRKDKNKTKKESLL